MSWIVVLSGVTRAETVVDKPSTTPTTQADDYSDPCSYGGRPLTTERCAQWRAALATEEAATWTKRAAIASGLSFIGVAIALFFAARSYGTARDDLYYNHPPKLLAANPQMWEAGNGVFAGNNVIPPIRKGLMIEGCIFLLNSGPGAVKVKDANCFFHWGPLTMNAPQWTEQEGKENWPEWIMDWKSRKHSPIPRSNPELIVGTHYIWNVASDPAPSDDAELYLIGAIGFVDSRFSKKKRVRHGIWFTWKYDAERKLFVESKDPEHGGSH